VLKDQPLVAPGEALTIERSRPHGHVEAVPAAMRRLGLARFGHNRDGERDRPCIVYGVLTDGAGRLSWKRNEAKIAAESAVDGIYVIRTSEPAGRLSAEDAVRNYRGLAHVARAFRTLKGIDLRVRPIYHRLADHVRGHLLLCLLAYYVEWHMRKALAPLLFADEELDDARRVRDPVKPAQPSEAAKAKRAGRQTADGLEVHSFRTLLAELATCCRNRCRFAAAGPDSPKSGGAAGPAVELEPLEIVTEQTPLQARAMDLLAACSQYRKP